MTVNCRRPVAPVNVIDAIYDEVVRGSWLACGQDCWRHKRFLMDRSMPFRVKAELQLPVARKLEPTAIAPIALHRLSGVAVWLDNPAK